MPSRRRREYAGQQAGGSTDTMAKPSVEAEGNSRKSNPISPPFRFCRKRCSTGTGSADRAVLYDFRRFPVRIRATYSPLVASARRFLQAEGVIGIPSWGKFWLALLNLYDWRGVNAILPELWSLPRWIALHPSNWYCHTRLIYMAMAAIYARRFQAPVTPLIESIREELFPRGFAEVDFSTGRNRLRADDLYARPSRWLRAGYGIARVFERLHGKRLRARCVDGILGRIKWELQTTGHASISPVSGFLNILALWLHDPDDTDCRQALEQLDGWIWEDEEEGARVTGARSASWDTGHSLQALATISELDGVPDALRKGAGYLRRQQNRRQLRGISPGLSDRPEGRLVLPRKLAWLAGHRLHRGSRARDDRSAPRRRGHDDAPGCG